MSSSLTRTSTSISSSQTTASSSWTSSTFTFDSLFSSLGSLLTGLSNALYFASFLISFLLVDNRNHKSLQSRPTSQIEHIFIAPWRKAGWGNNKDENKGSHNEKAWYWGRKGPKIARMEIGSALELRWMVTLGILAGAVTMGWAGVWVIVRLIR
ncbi:hypothetical protein MMC14_003505 [Varicellaria rhodocarpa]|nr:hypothetical protein [Varicellaria rhodocarpa]